MTGVSAGVSDKGCSFSKCRSGFLAIVMLCVILPVGLTPGLIRVTWQLLSVEVCELSDGAPLGCSSRVCATKNQQYAEFGWPDVKHCCRDSPTNLSTCGDFSGRRSLSASNTDVENKGVGGFSGSTQRCWWAWWFFSTASHAVRHVTGTDFFYAACTPRYNPHCGTEILDRRTGETTCHSCSVSSTRETGTRMRVFTEFWTLPREYGTWGARKPHDGVQIRKSRFQESCFALANTLEVLSTSGVSTVQARPDISFGGKADPGSFSWSLWFSVAMGQYMKWNNRSLDWPNPQPKRRKKGHERPGAALRVEEDHGQEDGKGATSLRSSVVTLSRKCIVDHR